MFAMAGFFDSLMALTATFPLSAHRREPAGIKAEFRVQTRSANQARREINLVALRALHSQWRGIRLAKLFKDRAAMGALVVKEDHG